jgi:hypothetical protein
LFVAFAAVAACGHDAPPAPATAPLPPAATGELRAPQAFASIADPAERSRQMFVEASRVFLHPRCVNCHPTGDVPHQRDDLQLHDPPVTRGEDDRGVVGMRCGTCHQDDNLPLARVPGAKGAEWHLAPREAAWVGRSPAAICAQLKDKTRNGNRTLAQIADHAAHDPLVTWAWAPGQGRTSAPGTQAAFGALVAAWIETGAACPTEKP